MKYGDPLPAPDGVLRYWCDSRNPYRRKVWAVWWGSDKYHEVELLDPVPVIIEADGLKALAVNSTLIPNMPEWAKR